METLIGKGIIVYALYTLGMLFSDVLNSRNRGSLRKIQTAKRILLSVDWKPKSMLPEEAKKFR